MKHILISGGSRGIGAALVRGLCDAGFRVSFLYKNAKDKATALASDCGANAICCDVSDPDAVRAAVGEARRAGGEIHALICNAGISHVGLSRDITDAELRRVLDTNLAGAMYLCREAQGDMIRAGGGRILCIGSMWGKVGASMEVAY